MVEHRPLVFEQSVHRPCDNRKTPRQNQREMLFARDLAQAGVAEVNEAESFPIQL